MLAATGGGCSGDRRLGHQTVSVLSIEDLVSCLKVVGRLLMFGRKGRGRAGLTRSLRFCRSEGLLRTRLGITLLFKVAGDF